jgi:hypothetical protein
MVRTTASWREILANKGSYAMAERILQDIVGYRSNSAARIESVNQLSNAILAIIELTNAEARNASRPR